MTERERLIAAIARARDKATLYAIDDRKTNRQYAMARKHQMDLEAELYALDMCYQGPNGEPL